MVVDQQLKFSSDQVNSGNLSLDNKVQDDDQSSKTQSFSLSSLIFPALIIGTIVLLIGVYFMFSLKLSQQKDQILQNNEINTNFTYRDNMVLKDNYLLKTSKSEANQSSFHFFQNKIHTFKKDQIATHLYGQDLDKIAKRKQYQKEKIDFLKGLNAENQPLKLIMYNLEHDEKFKDQQKFDQKLDYERLNRKYNFSNYPEEIHFCFSITGKNNDENNRIQYNLNSVFKQNYTNFKVLITDDASTDDSQRTYQRYFEIYNISKVKYSLFLNTQQKGALFNAYNMIKNYCENNSIVVQLDADDELIGVNVLKTLNAFYQSKKKAMVVYSYFYYYQQHQRFYLSNFGQSTYARDEVYFRKGQQFSHLKTFRSDFIHQIDVEKYLKNANGQWFKAATDHAIIFPVLELSCGEFYRIHEMLMSYTMETRENYRPAYLEAQLRNGGYIQKLPHMNCSSTFYERRRQERS